MDDETFFPHVEIFTPAESHEVTAPIILPNIQRDRQNLNLFNPFPKQTTTLITAPSNSGKTFYLKSLLRNSHLYFETPVTKVIVFNQNSKVSFLSPDEDYVSAINDNKDDEINQSHVNSFENNGTSGIFETVDFNGSSNNNNNNNSVFPFPIEEYSISEPDFDFDTLSSGTVVIFEDVVNLTPTILECINVRGHHQDLSHIFVVSHGILGNSHQFQLLNYVHRLILFTSTKAVTRLAKYLVSNFFTDKESQNYLKKVIGIAERSKSVLHIELNGTAQSAQHLALSHVTSLASKGFCFIFPFPYFWHKYKSRDVSHLYSVSDEIRNDVMQAMVDDTVPQFVFIDGSHFKDMAPKLQLEPQVDNETEACLDQNDDVQFAAVKANLQSDIKKFMRTDQQFDALNLLDEILHNPCFCISHEGRRLKFARESDKKSISLIDFLFQCIRKNGPNEKHKPIHDIYQRFVKCMIDNNTPETLFKNRLLLMPIENSFPEKNRLNRQRVNFSTQKFSGDFVNNRPRYSRRLAKKHKLQQQQQQLQSHSWNHITPFSHHYSHPLQQSLPPLPVHYSRPNYYISHQPPMQSSISY